jgi:hypothetical protein
MTSCRSTLRVPPNAYTAGQEIPANHLNMMRIMGRPIKATALRDPAALKDVG